MRHFLGADVFLMSSLSGYSRDHDKFNWLFSSSVLAKADFNICVSSSLGLPLQISTWRLYFSDAGLWLIIKSLQVQYESQETGSEYINVYLESTVFTQRELTLKQQQKAHELTAWSAWAATLSGIPIFSMEYLSTQPAETGKCNYPDVWEISGRHSLGMESTAQPCKGPWNCSVLETWAACSDSSAISESLTELQSSSLCCIPGTAIWQDSVYPSFLPIPAAFAPEAEFIGLKFLLSGSTSFPHLKREIEQ